MAEEPLHDRKVADFPSAFAINHKTVLARAPRRAAMTSGTIRIEPIGEGFQLVATDGASTITMPLEPQMLYALSVGLAKSLAEFEARTQPKDQKKPVIDLVSPSFSAEPVQLGVKLIFDGHGVMPSHYTLRPGQAIELTKRLMEAIQRHAGFEPEPWPDTSEE